MLRFLSPFSSSVKRPSGSLKSFPKIASRSIHIRRLDPVSSVIGEATDEESPSFSPGVVAEGTEGFSCFRACSIWNKVKL